MVPFSQPPVRRAVAAVSPAKARLQSRTGNMPVLLEATTRLRRSLPPRSRSCQYGQGFAPALRFPRSSLRPMSKGAGRTCLGTTRTSASRAIPLATTITRWCECLPALNELTIPPTVILSLRSDQTHRTVMARCSPRFQMQQSVPCLQEMLQVSARRHLVAKLFDSLL